MCECSAEFNNAFSSMFGSYMSTCTCGITYFASMELDTNDQGMLDSLKQKAIEQPEKYIDTVDYGVRHIDVGRLYVADCKCGTGLKYENWIWEHRNQITEYIRARARKEFTAAQEQANLLLGD